MVCTCFNDHIIKQTDIGKIIYEFVRDENYGKNKKIILNLEYFLSF